jgi:hypothetical protein
MRRKRRPHPRTALELGGRIELPELRHLLLEDRVAQVLPHARGVAARQDE